MARMSIFSEIPTLSLSKGREPYNKNKLQGCNGMRVNGEWFSKLMVQQIN